VVLVKKLEIFPLVPFAAVSFLGADFFAGIFLIVVGFLGAGSSSSVEAAAFFVGAVFFAGVAFLTGTGFSAAVLRFY
jgi:hypothetical protein